MKWLRIILLFVFFGPIGTAALDVCCAFDNEDMRIVQMDPCGSEEILEAGLSRGHENQCADCTLCHLQSFSPNAQQDFSQSLAGQSLTIFYEKSFLEIAATVLTPPPTL